MKYRFVLPAQLRQLQEELTRLPSGLMIEARLEDYSPPLPDNLRARVHIAIRDLAIFTGYSETQMKYTIVKEQFYPKEIKLFRGEQREVPVDTMKLTPAQAREVEAHLHVLASEIGCPMSSAQSHEP